MWAIMAGMMHWHLLERPNWSRKTLQTRSSVILSNAIIAHDHGERASETFGLVGCAFLTLMHAVDKAEELGPTSKMQDLKLLMCMALEWTHDQSRYGIHARDLVWREHVGAYARKNDIDLKDAPLHNADELVTSLSKRKRVRGSKSDRWSWRQEVSCGSRVPSSATRLADRDLSLIDSQADTVPNLLQERLC